MYIIHNVKMKNVVCIFLHTMYDHGLGYILTERKTDNTYSEQQCILN